jgi:magnesium transporter
MNFKHMPELEWQWSYPILWVFMVGVAGGMLYYFRRKHWF